MLSNQEWTKNKLNSIVCFLDENEGPYMPSLIGFVFYELSLGIVLEFTKHNSFPLKQENISKGTCIF